MIRKIRILILEQDESIQRCMAEYLTDKGYIVAVTPSTEDALEKVRHQTQLGDKFDMVIMNLPFQGDTTPTQLAKYIRVSSVDTSFVLLSGDKTLSNIPIGIPTIIAKSEGILLILERIHKEISRSMLSLVEV